ncbi:exodeoxyribonuclease III [Ahrensia sp. R2A130]|uniref:exodeoxyribonuclease III n=1 Tax=Ahrensia sp. R2A130 TaxID=744979 RepID=UPI0001E08C9D|nr:exodeoxyribonuclease III [Ahrensia sp. R2A130]EFL88119.1 exodeoxyribonuclease III protein [Ahrensia sp. R2A130]
MAKPFSIATWNINSVRLRIGLVEKFLAEHQPDVLCLQEIKCVNELFPADAFTAAGYPHHAVHGQKGYHGVATVSKHPLTETASADYVAMGDTRHVECIVQSPGGPVRMHNFYVPAGGDVADPAVNPKFDHKMKFIEEMKALGCDDGDVPAILVGDLNIAPLETDVWSHKQLLKVVSHTPVETDGLNEVMAKGGWTDLIRQHIPAEDILFTWWSYRSKDWDAADKGRRLDHIWSSPKLASSLSKIEVLREARGWEKPSDHVPVIARFDFT